MIQANWKETLVAILASASMAWGQQALSPYAPNVVTTERIMTVQENGKAPQQCKILKTEKQADGSLVHQVQNLTTGEVTTMTEGGAGRFSFFGQKKAPMVTTTPAVSDARIAPVAQAAPDWRQSWGKTEITKVEAKETMPTPMPTPSMKDSDPLTTPEKYSRRPLDGWKTNEITVMSETPMVNGTVVSETVQPVSATGEVIVIQEDAVPAPEAHKPAPKRRGSLLSFFRKNQETMPVASKRVVMAPETVIQPVSATEMEMPNMGMKSVMAAGTTPASVCYVPVPVVTIPDRNRAPVPPQAPQGPYSQQVQVTQTYNPSNTVPFNAFTNYKQPAPVPQEVLAARERAGNAFSTMPEMPMPAMTAPAGYAMMPNAYQAAPQAAGMPMTGQQVQSSAGNAQLLMALLTNSVYPSEREWAADSLAKGAEQSSPLVVQALLKSAAEDPAATVRAACIRHLGPLSATYPQVTSALYSFRSDADPVVQKEVERVLQRVK